MEDRIEKDNPGWPGGAGVVEEYELHASGTCGKYTKVCSFGGGCRAQRIRMGDMSRLSSRLVKG
jgi:hypothetical protein